MHENTHIQTVAKTSLEAENVNLPFQERSLD